MYNLFSANATSIIFIDSKVENYEFLAPKAICLADRPFNYNNSVIILNPQKDGIEQITEFLRQHPQIKTVHIVSHGSPGCVYLGNSELSLNTLEKYTPKLKSWFKENTSKAMLLLYGCKVASGDAGEEFINKLHHITGAEIAASNTLTGNQALGGDWELQVKTSDFEAPLAFSEEVRRSYSGVLATFIVNTRNDVVDANENRTSLREAIEAANVTPGADEITFARGLTGRTIKILNESLSITDDLSIVGPENRRLTIQGDLTGFRQPIFNIDDQEGENKIAVSLQNFTLRGAQSNSLIGITNLERLMVDKVNISGLSRGISNTSVSIGIGNTSEGDLAIKSSRFSGNSIGIDNVGSAKIERSNFARNGTGIDNSGVLELTRGNLSKNSNAVTNSGNLTINQSIIRGNSGTAISSSFGNNVQINQTSIDNNGGTGISSSFAAGALTINQSTISGNTNGGISLGRGDTTIINSTISGNSATNGGGISVQSSDANLQIINSTITKNSAETGSGINISSGKATIGNTIIYGNGNSDVVGAKDSFETLGNNIVGSGDATIAFDVTKGDKLLGKANPKLGRLKRNGGLTRTHAITNKSTAYNAGNNALIPQEVTTDQRGGRFARVVNDTVDIGAFELRTRARSTSEADPLLGKVDMLTGTSESDLFKLGNREYVKYARHQFDDYLIINNFDPTEDVIRLHGTKQDYDLEQTTQGSISGVGIFLKGSGEKELIALVTEVSDFSLGGDYLSFV